VLALVIAATPACASLAPRLEIPVAAAQTPDQRAYALLNTYAAMLEEAADIARDPAVPIEMKRALARAEAAATPAVEALHAALGVYLTARDDRAAALLGQASEAAETPVATLLELVRAEHGGAP
jgi:hypothetical protein